MEWILGELNLNLIVDLNWDSIGTELYYIEIEEKSVELNWVGWIGWHRIQL